MTPLENIIAAAARDPGRWYWLSHCEGFAAISPDGQLGIVDCVLLAEDGNLPEALLLRIGIVRQRLVEVPIEAVRDVFPRRRQVILGSDIQPALAAAPTLSPRRA